MAAPAAPSANEVVPRASEPFLSRIIAAKGRNGQIVRASATVAEIGGTALLATGLKAYREVYHPKDGGFYLFHPFLDLRLIGAAVAYGASIWHPTTQTDFLNVSTGLLVSYGTESVRERVTKFFGDKKAKADAEAADKLAEAAPVAPVGAPVAAGLGDVVIGNVAKRAARVEDRLERLRAREAGATRKETRQMRRTQRKERRGKISPAAPAPAALPAPSFSGGRRPLPQGQMVSVPIAMLGERQRQRLGL